MPGPPPKRSSQRRRVNKPVIPVTVADGAVEVVVPVADEGWHPVARGWFESLAGSGQSAFYEPSDWAVAVLVAESMSRELWGDGPVSGAALMAWLRAMTALMVTEGDRRRLRLELERRRDDDGDEVGGVSEIELYRRRLESG